MRLTLSHAVLLGLAAAFPIRESYLPGTSLGGRGLSADHTVDLTSGQIYEDATLERVADVYHKRRHVLWAIGTRGIPKLGEKPPPGKPGKDKPDVPTPGGKPGGNKGGDGAGNAPGTGTGPKFADANLESARAKGERLSNSLDDAIFKNTQAPELKDLRSLGYTRAGKQVLPFNIDDKKHQTYLLGLNINVEEKWSARVVFRKDTVSTARAPILETYTDASQGAIVVKQSWKDRDQPVPKATWTDMVHDSWLDVCKVKGNDPRGLKYVIRDNIQYQTTRDSKGIELNTQLAINAAFERMSADKTKTLKIDAKSTDANAKASYELLSAQTHVARVLQWLKDRHRDLGDKKIANLHVNHQDHPSGQYNIVIELA